jgi:cell division protein FtsX
MAEFTVEGLVLSLVSIVVGVALIPIVYNQVVAANITDPTVAALVSLIPFLFALSIVIGVIKPLF